MALQRAPPLPRRLVDQNQVPPYLSPAYTDFGSFLSRVRLAGEQGEIITGFKTGFQLSRLPVQPEREQGQTHIRTLAGLNYQDSNNTVRSGVQSLIGLLTATEKQVHLGRLPYEAETVALEQELEGTRITRKGDASPQVAPPSLKMVAGGK